MRLFQASLLMGILCGWPAAAVAQFQLFTNQEPQAVFGGGTRQISATFHNPAPTNSEREIRARIYQASSATAAFISDNSGIPLQVPAGETVLTSAALRFPAVKSEAKFIVQWLDNSDRVIGATSVMVYPANLLQSLQTSLCQTNLGVLDPNNQLKPLLKQNGVEFLDLGDTELEDYQGQVAVIGPFQSRDQVRDGLANDILRMAKNGAIVIWLQPPPPPNAELRPSFYIVPAGKGAVLVVQATSVADLPDNPRSQLNLIAFCQWALNPRPWALPGLSPP